MPGFFRAATALVLVLLAGTALTEVPVRVEPAADRPIVRQINVTGTVTSSRTAVLSTAVAGLVAELLVDEGYRVTTGDVLVNLDAELAQLALERAVAGLQQRETALEDAKRRFAEAEQVAEQRSIARSQVESLRAEVASNEAAVVAAQAAVREQRAIVARHSLKAPFAGVISERFAELGEWVSPGDGLLELVETDNLRFDFRVGQEHFNSLSPQTPVEIRLDAVPDEVIPGHIDTIVPVKNPGARTFLVRVLADARAAEEPLRVTPGMSVRGSLKVDTGRLGVAVSRDAILRFPDGRVTVWVVDSGGDVPVVHERVVRTGSEFNGIVEVTDGLESGDLVVVRGNETLLEGQTVSILEGSL
ncbi:MAG: efflux RND transporter periplasmic adaptor subunit [Thiotrichales bacterium]|nr:efflux RND transporter periplasmic adaptor subunit [Thiotrichales bacterium]